MKSKAPTFDLLHLGQIQSTLDLAHRLLLTRSLQAVLQAIINRPVVQLVRLLQYEHITRAEKATITVQLARISQAIALQVVASPGKTHTQNTVRP